MYTYLKCTFNSYGNTRVYEYDEIRCTPSSGGLSFYFKPPQQIKVVYFKEFYPLNLENIDHSGSSIFYEFKGQLGVSLPLFIVFGTSCFIQT